MTTRLILCVLLIIISPWLLAKELILLHTNDFHGHIQQEGKYAGAAKIAAFVKEIKAQHPAALFLDAGDAISGTPVSSMFEGEPIFDVMNAMDYDVGLIGNHEFDHGYKKIERFRAIANHPLLTANAIGPDGELLGDAPYLLLNLDGIRVGIIGLITETAPTLFSPTGNEGLTFLNPADRLSELVPMLRPKTDVLILLSHIGHEGELVLAEQFQDLDLIIGGHSHTLVQHPVRVGKTLVAQANHYGSHLGLIKIKVPDTGQARLVIQGDLIAANELPDGDPATQALVSSYEAKVEDQVDIKIAVIRKNYSKIELQPILEDILAEAIGADLGYYNRTGIRDVLSEGDVTARMIWNLEPFGNTLVKLTLSGADLLILLSQEPALHHAVDAIDPERRYQLATNSFIASHATLAFGDAITAVDTGILVRDILIQQIKAKGLQ